MNTKEILISLFVEIFVSSSLLPSLSFPLFVLSTTWHLNLLGGGG